MERGRAGIAYGFGSADDSQHCRPSNAPARLVTPKADAAQRCRKCRILAVRPEGAYHQKTRIPHRKSATVRELTSGLAVILALPERPLLALPGPLPCVLVSAIGHGSSGHILLGQLAAALRGEAEVPAVPQEGKN